MPHVQKLSISQYASSNQVGPKQSKESFGTIQNNPNIKHFKKMT